MKKGKKNLMKLVIMAQNDKVQKDNVYFIQQQPPPPTTNRTHCNEITHTHANK